MSERKCSGVQSIFRLEPEATRLVVGSVRIADMLFQPEPMIVRVVEQPVQGTSMADVIVGAIGLTGFLLVTAALLGLVLGGILIGVKKLRARYGVERELDADALRVTPHSLS